MKVYEITYITESEETIDAKVISPLLAEQKAKIVSVHPWGGRRKLVYPIKKQDQAFYTTVVFEADPAAIAPLNRALQLNNAVLRALVVDYVPGYFERTTQQSDEAEASKPKETEPAKEESADSAPITPETELASVEEATTPATVSVNEEASAEEKTEPVTASEDKKPARRTKKTQKTENLDEKLDALLKEDITQ